ncbi:hypothetical protein Btru_018409 [Bulinus truncatus]|nr:hypothetical protein Btru_018409 [Bulinus truncatus]
MSNSISKMINNQGNNDEAPNYNFQTGSDSFISRSKDVFASLGVLEEKHAAFLKSKVLSHKEPELMKEDPEDEVDETACDVTTSKERFIREQRSRLGQTRDSDFEPRSHSRSPNRHSIRDVNEKSQRNESGVFKRPHKLPSQHHIPDFKRHPEKYTCYTLSDVSEKDLSEKSNQKAAFDFLQERRLTREKELLGLSEEEVKFDVSEAACSHGKILFSRNRAKKDPQNHSEQTSYKDSSFSNSDGTDTSDPDGDGDQLVDAKKESKTEAVATGFKSRKIVRRQVRKGDNEGNSD